MPHTTTETTTETMTQPTILHNTFVIEHSYPVPPERLFAAFADPGQKRKWFVESPNNDVKEYSLDFRVGGNEIVYYQMLPGTPLPGALFSVRSNYQLINPGKQIVAANTMILNDHCISAALISFEFLPTASGTDLVCTHQAAFFEGADGPEMRQMGWKSLLDKLAKVLEA